MKAILSLIMFDVRFQKIPPFLWGIQEAEKQEKDTFRMIQEEIDEHRRTRDAKEPRDFIDCFLQEMDERSRSSELLSDGRGNRARKFEGFRNQCYQLPVTEQWA